MARIQSSQQIFRLAGRRTMEQLQKVHVRVAKREHTRIMATDPRPAAFTRFVDGREGALEESVRPGGVIVYRYPRLVTVAQFAMETLFDLSPVLSGEYLKSHMYFVNGMPAANLESWRPGMEIVISNLTPYSRKIEVGKMKMRVPATDHVYQQTAKKVRARYGNLASVTFTYRGIVGGMSVNPETAGKPVLQRTIVRGPNGRFTTGTRTVRVSGGEHNKREARYPVLLIREL